MRASGFFVLRTPLLPFDELLAWSESVTPARAHDDDDSIMRDRQELRARLAVIVRRPEVREALFVASPTAYASLDAWSRNPESETGQKLEKTLVRYVSRMSSRATPFGLFAGCSVGLLGATTQLTLCQTPLRTDPQTPLKLTPPMCSVIGLGRAEKPRSFLLS
jgi:hypothetical protein